MAYWHKGRGGERGREGEGERGREGEGEKRERGREGEEERGGEEGERERGREEAISPKRKMSSTEIGCYVAKAFYTKILLVKRRAKNGQTYRARRRKSRRKRTRI
ncbi:MAG: hypothetical protein EAZ09_13705 [Oscillatoriales cyanobacterium]|nr:MAG: hypothetical protein EAZ18_11765 [Oscillatoriales cyanobacterium]TAH20703.1 MAG: hypothetical protein EAZ09_13705 [Oscillatoriales cyanobacterium]